MFAAAIAHGLGIGVENIRQGLRTFTNDFFQAPGRLNFYNEHPFRVLLDYAHNAHGMEAVARTVRELAVHGRRIGVIAAPGDRRDEDILRPGRGRGARLRPRADPRGRRPAGPPARRGRRACCARGCSTPAFPAERIVPEYFSEEDAVLRALEMACAGDLVVIFGDKLARIWELIVNFKPKPSAVKPAGPVGGAPQGELVEALQAGRVR